MRIGALLSALCLPGIVCAVALEKREDKKPSTKYFHEPGRSDITGHYDIRYFKDIVDYDTRKESLEHMMRAWLQVTAKEGIETWIAHGTLLGWWWNGKLLPWDWDIDVQVLEPTLKKLGTPTYNQTHWPYTSLDGKFKRDYFLDVGNMIWERVRGDGNNNIDARWIDTTTGLFIDITGISETDPKNHPGQYHCKNYHFYQYSDIYPLRDVYFEGVPAKIPYNYDEILIKEYKARALTVTEFEGHRWNPQTKIWDKIEGNPHAKQKTLRTEQKFAEPDPLPSGVFSVIYKLFHWW